MLPKELLCMLKKLFMKKISLIIPAYNEESYIWECIRYALQNNFYEIIVVDNASTDATAQIARDMWVSVVHQPIKWLTKARQAGYEYATWDICAFVDSDTRMPVWRSEHILSLFDRDIVFVSGPYTYYDASTLQNLWVWIYRKFAYIICTIVWYMWVWWNFAISRSTLDTLWWFDQTISFYGEDTDIARRAHSVWKTIFDPKLIMPTSARRFVWQWFINTAYHYMINFYSQVLRRKPHTSKYQDFR